jgi:ArsR family transcriptional regulator
MKRDLQAVDQVFKALADPTRVRILGLLAAGETCVCHIHETLRLPQSLVSRHLAYLRRTGLVDARKEGLWVHYRLAARRDDVTRTLLDAVYHCVGHLLTVARDAKRLEKKTGCCAVAQPAPTFECCRPAPEAGEKTSATL